MGNSSTKILPPSVIKQDTQTFLISGADLYFQASKKFYTNQKVKIEEILKRPPFWFNTKIQKFTFEKKLDYETKIYLWCKYSEVRDKNLQIADHLLREYPKLLYSDEINQRIIIGNKKEHLLPILQNIDPNKMYRVTINFYFQIISDNGCNTFVLKKMLNHIEEVNDESLDLNP